MTRASTFPPTAKQLALLRFIAGYQQAHGGRSPNRFEMCEGVGVAGMGTIHAHLHGLQNRGHLRIHARRARAIELLTIPALPHAPDGTPLFAVPLKGIAHGPTR